MPVVKRKDGWYWGSRGPYDTKEKAESVGRAAYASGYRSNTQQSKPKRTGQ